MVRISIAPADRNQYHVRVSADDGTSSTHVVTLWPSDVARYAPGATPDALLDASFRFLLDREPKESILARFDLAAIERYFREYPRVIASYLGGS